DGDNVDLRFEDAEGRDTGCDVSIVEYAEKAADLFEQHDRIVGALRAEIAMLRSYESEWELLLNEHEQQRDAAMARVAELEAKLVRVTELERQEPVSTEHLPMHIAYARAKREVFLGACQEDVFRFALIDLLQEFPLYAAPVAQAQPEETPGEILAAKLIETWVTEHGKPAPWSTAVEITAVATNMPNDERDRLLALDDDVDAQAQHSVPDDVETFLDEVRAELLRARSKFPGDRIMTIALAEEFGELCKAVLDEPAANVRKEAVQTAVMAARVVLDGDGSVTAWRAERGLDPLAAAPGKEGL
ncbi:hypothetical protein ACIUXA_32020, partial [Pseudomonas aeruginosa]